MNTLRRRELTIACASLLASPLFIRHARAADAPLFPLGVASGQPMPNQFVLWTRLLGPDLPQEVPVQWELAHDEAFTRIAAQGTEQARAAWAHSVHAEPADLEPGRWYWYRFTALGQRSMVGRTRTAPAADAPATLNFAIASCQRWDQGHYAAWRHMAGEGLDLVLFLGDYIYETASPAGALRAHEGGAARSLDQYRARYAQYKSDPALQAAHAACPWLLTWDDHEVENDYANERGQSAVSIGFMARRAAAYQAYWEHQPFAKSARPSGAHMRVHQRLDWGWLARIHTLDNRQHRDVQACSPLGSGGASSVALKDCPELQDPRRSLLGAAQEQWLSDGWDTQRPWNLLGQQTLMARRSWGDASGEPSHFTDGWDGYAPARKRLLEGAAQRQLPGLVVLGGDVHVNYVADLKTDFDDAKAPVVGTEFCGTSISSRGGSQRRTDAAMAHNPHLRLGRADKRGYIAFALDDKALQARLMAVRRVEDAASAVDTMARFVVAHGQPGAQPA